MKKYKATGCARFFVVMLILAPLAYVGASLYNGQDPIQNIKDLFAFEAKEVRVWIEIGTETRSVAIYVDLTHEACLGHGFQAVVNRGQIDGGHLALGPVEDLRRGRMIPLVHQHVVNHATLSGHSKVTLQFQRFGPVGILLFGLALHWSCWVFKHCLPEILLISRIIPRKTPKNHPSP